MRQMTVGTPQIIRGCAAIPIADNGGSEDQERKDGKANGQGAQRPSCAAARCPIVREIEKVFQKIDPLVRVRKRPALLYLQHVAFLRHHFVQDRIDEESQEQARNQARDNHDGERLLRV